MKSFALSTVLTASLTVFSIPAMAHQSLTTGAAHSLEHGTIYSIAVAILVLASMATFLKLARSTIKK